jgi:nitroreductase
MAEPQPGYWSKLASQDCAAAIQNMMLMASAHGVASCWFSAYADMDGTFRMKDMKWSDVLPQKGNLQPFGILQLGYSTRMQGDVEHRGRKVERNELEAYLI